MNVRLTHIDGRLPNLALMKLAHWHRARGDTVHFTRRVYRDMLEPAYDRVYGSAIFSFSGRLVERFRAQFPEAVIGGTGGLDPRTIEQEIGYELYERYDYSDYPTFQASIGFTQRGCRLKCGFCVVPKKEGKPHSTSSIWDLWRGDPYPRHIHLLDNDFFGQPRDAWRARIAEIKAGRFKVSFTQGINIRLVDDEVAAALSEISYLDDQFYTRRLYTAWDNLKDEKVFFRGVETLKRGGVPPTHLLAYMLVGWDKDETWERVLYRFNRMQDIGIKPYPMIYGDKQRGLPAGNMDPRIERRTLSEFQRWAVGRGSKIFPFTAYDKSQRKLLDRRQFWMPI